MTAPTHPHPLAHLAPAVQGRLTALAADGGKHSAKVTHWSDRIGWVVGLGLFVALVYWLMRQGWQWRRTLQGGLPALPQPPEEPGAALLTLAGRYHGSTTAGQWLDRIVAHGLGVRSRAQLTLTAQGLLVERTGAPGFFVPAAALRGARLDRAIAGKVLPEGGLLVVTWEHGGTLIDSGFRSEHAAEHAAWVAALTRTTGGDTRQAQGAHEEAQGAPTGADTAPARAAAATTSASTTASTTATTADDKEGAR
ncbi:PH-like domain-containing protein [Actinacidiphila guanduensis]|uniref:PH domain-containing protein n=1 Tax=Actinacidiphila guanduensis TaxID=310781 RepID=A0A1H0QDV6_9ACTN|nr:hypothetical protein [Actinacidiphila guanduensis]SDP15573.1 hypothetical protein SAMN05216259_11884 [Actinacidiphila guanduensis]